MDKQPSRFLCREYAAAGLTASATLRELRAGTAGSTARIESGGGRFFLRCRSREHSSPANMRYEHDLILRLAEAGLPVAPPLPTQSGKRFVAEGEAIYELYPWIDGELFEDGNATQIRAVGDLLSRFHDVGRGLGERKIGQGREDDPCGLRRDLGKFLPPGDSAKSRPLVDQVETHLRELERRLNAAVYDVLPETVIHGDFHPGNLLFRDDKITGLFDFDWANRRERIRDLGDGLLFFAGRRGRTLFPGDIWSLTDGVEVDPGLAEVFLAAYESRSALLPEERGALPVVMAARWLQIRIRGMRKVDPSERLRFLDRGDLLDTYHQLRLFEPPRGPR